jgi:hypothetical protein
VLGFATLGDGPGNPDADRVVAPGLEHRRVVEASLARLPLQWRRRDRRTAAGLRRCLLHPVLSLPGTLFPPPVPERIVRRRLRRGAEHLNCGTNIKPLLFLLGANSHFHCLKIVLNSNIAPILSLQDGTHV